MRVGKLVPLKYAMGGTWSRPITEDHRLALPVLEADLMLLWSCHYYEQS
ncbi:type II toxin-antitoxin system YoeB family toxin [Ferrimicrobium sp.]